MLGLECGFGRLPGHVFSLPRDVHGISGALSRFLRCRRRTRTLRRSSRTGRPHGRGRSGSLRRRSRWPRLVGVPIARGGGRFPGRRIGRCRCRFGRVCRRARLDVRTDRRRSRRLSDTCFGNDRVRDDRGRRARSDTGVVAGAQERSKRDDEANGRCDGGRTGQRTRSTEGNALRQTSHDRTPISDQPANRTIRVPLVTGTMRGFDLVCALTTQNFSVRRCAVLDELRFQPIGDMPHANLRCPSPRGGEKGQAGNREQ